MSAISKPAREAAPRRQLASFIGKYSPAIAKLGRAALARMRERVPGAFEIVYDSHAGLVVGFGPTARASDSVFSIAFRPDHISLCFLDGAALPDPKRWLRGGGGAVRHVRLDDVAMLDDPYVRDLMGAALARAKVPFDSSQGGRIEIRAVAVRQRPRRPTAGEK